VRTHTYDIRLTRAEAVVLFALLHRLDEGATALDDADRAVAHSLLGLLEGALAERIDLGYADSVARAKTALATARR
jgi:hypothetical protein